MHYNHSDSKEYVLKQLEMEWDREFAERVDQVANENGITQEQFDIMVKEYAWRVKSLFDPSLYKWTDRIRIALHFINPFNKGI